MFKSLGMSFLTTMMLSHLAMAVPLSSGGSNIPNIKSPHVLNQIQEHNREASLNGNLFISSSPTGLAVKRPVAEFEDTGYLVFHSSTDFVSADVKAQMIKNLPAGVTAVIYTDTDDKVEMEALYVFYSAMASNADQVKVITIPNPTKEITYPADGFYPAEVVEVSPTGFWTRDAVPVPVIEIANISNNVALSERMAVVDAKYYHYFEPDEYFADYFNAGLISHNYFYEGGNFMVNSKGDCIAIDTEETQLIPNAIFYKTYGCAQIIRLPFVKGIGHADESVKFITDNHILSDDIRYKKILEAKGFKVTMLPRPKRDLETYVNSLLINGTIFVPVFQQPSDQVAIDVYESLGLKVVPVDSSVLSNEGAGSVHCITMTYPSFTDFNDLLGYFGASSVVASSSNSAKVQALVRDHEMVLKADLDTLSDPGLDNYLDNL